MDDNLPFYDIVLIGDYFFDQIYTGLTEFPQLGREICSTGLTTTGGAIYITAVALRRLGVRVGWPAYFGNDYYNNFVYKLALAEDLDLSLARQVDRPYRLVTTSIPLGTERAFITFADPKPDDRHQHWLDSLERCRFRHLHLGGMIDRDLMWPLLERAWAQRATVSMDCQDGPHLAKPCDCRERLAQVDIFIPNVREARIVAEAEDVMAALRVLMQIVRIVVIKDGVNGAWCGHNQQITHIPAVCAGPVVDTTGAGDCFNAGFLMGLVCEHAALETCLRYGNICGGFSVTGVGGATHAPTRGQLRTWMTKITQDPAH